MKTGLRTKVLAIFLGLLLAIPVVGAGCEGETAPPASPSPVELSATLVPNLSLDVYVYGKQGSPTIVPAALTGAAQDLHIESLAIWGVPADDDFAFGAAVTLSNSTEAEWVLNAIPGEADLWKKLNGNIVFVVKGSGPAAESLRNAIINNNFKYYDDAEALKAVALLPGGDTTKRAAVALARPSGPLIDFLTEGEDSGGAGFINTMLKLDILKIAAGGLYSPQQIDITGLMKAMDSGGISGLDMGLLFVVKSGFPGLVVEPVVKKLLTDKEFVEASIGELTVYKRTVAVNNGQDVIVLVRIEGSHIFAAVSGRESYAQTLITGVQVE